MNTALDALRARFRRSFRPLCFLFVLFVLVLAPVLRTSPAEAAPGFGDHVHGASAVPTEPVLPTVHLTPGPKIVCPPLRPDGETGARSEDLDLGDSRIETVEPAASPADEAELPGPSPYLVLGAAFVLLGAGLAALVLTGRGDPDEPRTHR